ncbi:MAG: response regulator [Gammaproteobacteria bacterium]
MSTPGDRVQVLLVEDDDHLRIMLNTVIGERGYLVTMATTAAAAHRIASESDLDLVLLDLGLPDLDGAALIPLLKEVSAAPVIVISARDSEEQKVRALDAGADDYLTKPFGVSELLARMRSALRRAARDDPATSAATAGYRCGALVIDIARRQVTVGDRPVHLTPVEFRLLAALARRAGKVSTHRQLLREVWGPLHEQDGHYLRIYMRQLRGKIEAEPAQPRYLLTDPGVGYRLASE